MNSQKLENANKVIPKIFSEATLDKIKSNPLKEMIKAFYEKKDHIGFYIQGEPGVGKTFAAYAIFKYINDLGGPVRLIKAMDIIDAVKAGYSSGEKTLYQQDMEYFLGDLASFKGVLIVDDIGTEKFSEAVITEYYRIVNERYEEMRPTIYTSNFGLVELSDKVGDRIVSRIQRTTKAVELTN